MAKITVKLFGVLRVDTHIAKVKNLTDLGDYITLYAQWKPNSYSVTFNKNGATAGSMKKLNCKYDASYALKANKLKKKGYSFKEWNTKKDGTGTAYSDEATIKNLTDMKNGKVTLYAQWEANKYNAVFDGNGATAGTTAGMTNLAYGTEYNLITNGYTRTGYTFAGWNTKANGKGKKYTEGAKFKNLTSVNGADVTLYATWKPIKYNISYNDNGASTKGKTIIHKNVKYDKNVKIKGNIFKKKGYVLDSWNTKPDGTGTTYKKDVKVNNLCSENGSTFTLYAVWKEK